MDLTKRQQEIFDYIKSYSAGHGYPPTVRDIGKAVGLTSSSTVHAHLANLEKLGLLRRDPSKPRAIELLDRATRDARAAVSGVIGRVAPTAGLPVVGHNGQTLGFQSELFIDPVSGLCVAVLANDFGAVPEAVGVPAWDLLVPALGLH